MTQEYDKFIEDAKFECRVKFNIENHCSKVNNKRSSKKTIDAKLTIGNSHTTKFCQQLFTIQNHFFRTMPPYGQQWRSGYNDLGRWRAIPSFSVNKIARCGLKLATGDIPLSQYIR